MIQINQWKIKNKKTVIVFKKSNEIYIYIYKTVEKQMKDEI